MSEGYEIPLLEDLIELPWEEFFNKAAKKTCFDYSNLCFVKVGQEVDTKKRHVWEFIARIAGLGSSFDVPEEGFDLHIDLLMDGEIELAQNLLAVTSNAELRSRLADIVWTKKKKGNYQVVLVAIESYLDSARQLEDFENWTHCQSRIQRAYKLSVSIKNKELIRATIDLTKDVLSRCNGEDPLYLSARLMKLLLESDERQCWYYALASQKLASRAEQRGRFDLARVYWEINSDWHSAAENRELARLAAINAAETFVLASEARLENKLAPFIHASHDLEMAIKALKKISETETRVQELHVRMLNFQKRSSNELERFEAPQIDISAEMEKARSLVSEKSFHEAIFSLAVIMKPVNEKDTKKIVQDLANKFRFASLFSTTRMNALGRTVARHSGLFAKSPEEQEEAIRGKMYEQSQIVWNLHSQGIIEPAREQIDFEHRPSASDFLPLLSAGLPIISGRELIIARGLHAGLTGDLVSAMHFLIPQFEHSIRIVLYENNIIASGLEKDGIQHEFDLNKTLKGKEYKDALIEVLGSDTLFELRGLLVDAFGANFRNEMAHGLISLGGF